MGAFKQGKIMQITVLGGDNTTAITATALAAAGWARVTEVQWILGTDSASAGTKGSMELALRGGGEDTIDNFRSSSEGKFEIELASVAARLAQFDPAGPTGTADFIVRYTNTSPGAGTNDAAADVITILGD